MSAYKFIDGSKPISFMYPYQDIMISMTEALKNQEYISYIDLVGHLKNMAILSFDKKDIELLEKIENIVSNYKKYIDQTSKAKMNTSEIYSIENINSIYNRNIDLKILCEYRFSGIIERICIAALRKTILADMIPNAQSGNIYYESERDLRQVVAAYNRTLEENEISPLEVKL
ncbi:hypothetical protein [Methanosarcina horonobensis]|nr:hypothetical protein [Methanosarcina horonobensis]